MADLDAIRKRLEAATPGPWTVENNAVWYGDDMICDSLLPSDTVPDIEFIAHAPADVGALLAEVERLHDLADFQRRQAEIHCAKIAELDGEVERLLAALPDTELLERAAEYADIVWYRRRLVTGDSDLAPSDRDALRAAARIREAQC